MTLIQSKHQFVTRKGTERTQGLAAKPSTDRHKTKRLGFFFYIILSTIDILLITVFISIRMEESPPLDLSSIEDSETTMLNQALDDQRLMIEKMDRLTNGIEELVKVFLTPRQNALQHLFQIDNNK